MKSVFVVFSGEYLFMDINSKQLEGHFPVFRIEGVFSTSAKCDEWIDSHKTDKSISLLSYLEIPMDPVFGEKENDMEVFIIRMNKDLQIINVKVGESDAIPQGELFSYELLENGEIIGGFWARDFIDACKIAYMRVKESM